MFLAIVYLVAYLIGAFITFPGTGEGKSFGGWLIKCVLFGIIGYVLFKGVLG